MSKVGVYLLYLAVGPVPGESFPEDKIKVHVGIDGIEYIVIIRDPQHWRGRGRGVEGE